MAISLVKEVGHLASTSSQTIPVTSAPAAHHVLILSCGFSSIAGVSISSVTDTKGNTWTIDGSTGKLAIASTKQDVGALTTSDTITVNFAGSPNSFSGAVHEWAGLRGDVDQTATGSAATTSRDAGSTPSTTGLYELVWAAFGGQTTLQETSFTAGAGYSTPTTDFYTVGGTTTTRSTVEFEYQIVSAKAAYHPTGTGGASMSTVGLAVTYFGADVEPTLAGTSSLSATLVTRSRFVATLAGISALSATLVAYQSLVAALAGNSRLLPVLVPAFDQHQNFSYGIVATAPSPAASGTSLVLQSGQGARFPDPAAGAYDIAVWPAGQIALASNAEICRVVGKSGDTLTIIRAWAGSSARSVQVGDWLGLTDVKSLWSDLESKLALLAGPALFSGPIGFKPGVGVGGAVTTSGAAVELDGLSGAVTLSQTITNGTTLLVTVNNDWVDTTDVVIPTLTNAPAGVTATVVQVSQWSFAVAIRNGSGADVSGISFNFIVLKAVAS